MCKNSKISEVEQDQLNIKLVSCLKAIDIEGAKKLLKEGANINYLDKW